MDIQILPENNQATNKSLLGIHDRKLVAIFFCTIALIIFSGFYFFSRTQKSSVPVPVAAEPVGWTAQDAVAKATLVESVAKRSMQPLSAQAVKSKQDILRLINRK